MFIITLVYLQKKKYKETFTTLSYEEIKSKFNTLYESVIKYQTGNIETNGGVFTNGKTNLPSGWTGGLRTVDLYASGMIATGYDNDINKLGVSINNGGVVKFANGLVQFNADGIWIYQKDSNFSRWARLYIDDNRNFYIQTNCGHALAIQPDGNVWFGYVNKYVNQFLYN